MPLAGEYEPNPAEFVRDQVDGSYAVIALMAGAPTHPVWYRNVVADPRVELQDGRVPEEHGP